mgnify:CR=1 FL=1
MICLFEKRAARRENFAAGDLSFFRFVLFRGGRLVVFFGLSRFSAGGLSVFVKFGDFYSTSTVSQVKTLNKIVFLTFSFITFSTAFL